WQFTDATENHAYDAAPGFNAFATPQTKRTTAPLAKPAVNYLRIVPSRVSCETIGPRLPKSSVENLMLTTLAISNYRSLRNLIVPLRQLNLVTGPNGSGKSSVYRALRLLAETAQGGVIPSLAREGGLQSTLWAGPEKLGAAVK